MSTKAINTILNLKDNYSKTVNQVTSNTTKFKNTVSAVTSTINNLKSKTTSTFGSIAKSAVGIAAGYVGIKSAISYVKDGMEMAKNSQLATAQLEAVLKSTGGVAGMTKEQLLDLAGSYGSYTTYTKGAVLEGENLLLTFTNLGKDVLPDVTSTMLDMSTALKQDVSSSAMQLGKALNDPTTGLSKLSKQGVTFTEQQKKQIEAMQKAGDIAGAQKMMLEELQKEFGGSAKAAGETLPGKLQILKNTFSGLKKTVGEKFIPILYDITKFATDHLPQIKAIFTTVFDNVGKVVNGAVDIFKNNLMPVFLEIWQHAEPYIAKIRDFLPGAFEKVKEVAGNVFDSVKKFIDDNKESIGNYVGAFVDLAKTIWDSVSPAIENIAMNLLPKLQSAFSGNKGVLKDILDNATGVVNFIKNNWKEIEPIVTTIVLALGAYKLALMAVQTWSIIVGATTAIWSSITGVIEIITGATTIWAGVQEVLNGVMIANPIGLIITAIGLLCLAIYEVVTHWTDIWNWINKVWDIIQGNPILLFISTVLNPLGTAIMEIVTHWKDICEWVGKAWDWLTKWNDTKMEDKKANAYVTKENSQDTNTQNAMNSNLFNGATTSFGMKLGANATGTQYWSGGATRMNEYGNGEMAILPSGSKVIPAGQTDKILNNSNGGIHLYLTIQGNVIGNEQFSNQVGQHVYNQIQLAMINSK